MIRPAQAADIPAIHQMITELATYERRRHEVSATEDDLRAALLAGPDLPGGQPALFAHVAEEDGLAVGFALWFLSYSTCSAGTGSTWRTSTSSRSGAARATAGRCWRNCRGSVWSAGTAGWNGLSWTGTLPPAASTRRWTR